MGTDCWLCPLSVERTYAKIGATNRVGASLYALQQGLVAPVDGPQR